MDQDLDLSLSCDFAAPPELVFRHWTNAQNLATWFAPDGFETLDCEANAAPQGLWHVRYRSASGDTYTERGAFLVVSPFDYLELSLRITYPSGREGPLLSIAVRLTGIDGGTRMSFQQTGFDSREMRDGMSAGWQTCFAKLRSNLEIAA